MQKGEGTGDPPCVGHSDSPPMTSPFSSTGKCCLQSYLLPCACRGWERKAEVENLPQCIFNLKLYYFGGGPILVQTRDNGCKIPGWRWFYPNILLLLPCVLKELCFHRWSIYKGSWIKVLPLDTQQMKKLHLAPLSTELGPPKWLFSSASTSINFSGTADRESTIWWKWGKLWQWSSYFHVVTNTYTVLNKEKTTLCLTKAIQYLHEQQVRVVVCQKH